MFNKDNTISFFKFVPNIFFFECVSEVGEDVHKAHPLNSKAYYHCVRSRFVQIICQDEVFWNSDCRNDQGSREITDALGVIETDLPEGKS